MITPWWKNKAIAIPTAALTAAMLIACGSSGDTGEATEADNGTANSATGDKSGSKPDGLYKFGQAVKFDDGSTLTVGTPATFKRNEYAAGGEKSKTFRKFKITFKNNTKEIFDPTLTTVGASAAGEEGEAVFQEGFDSPTNKILPGKSVTWTAGFGLPSDKDLQVQVNVGFLDYGTVVFTK